MYKVLLIDDSPWIIKDLKYVIDWHQLGFEIIASCSNCKEAEAIINNFEPDLILSDIRLPRMTGLELMEMVRKRFPNIVVIFISAYDDFSYAKKAIQIGAFDYILKPYQKEKLKKVLIDAHHYLDQNKKLENMRKADLVLEIIETDIDHKSAKLKLEELGTNITKDIFSVMVIKSFSDDIHLDLANLINTIFEIINRPDYYSVQVGDSKGILLLNDDFTEKREDQVLKIDKLLIDSRINIGVSEPFFELSKFKNYYKQADDMVNTSFVMGESGLYIYKDYKNNHQKFIKKIQKIETNRELFTIIDQLPDMAKEECISFSGIVRIYNMIIKKAEKINYLSMDNLNHLDLLYTYNNLEELSDSLLEYFRDYTSKKTINSSTIIFRVKKYIDKNYNKNIKLSDIADKYDFNMSYLSHLFKKETGQTYTDYLIDRRINKAIKLFKDNLYLYEISKRVGYEDYYHFCKIFKKHTGFTPSEYKKTQTNNN